MFGTKLFQYNSRKILIIAFLFLHLQISIAGETGSIKGVVKDKSTGEVLPGANVFIKGTSIGTASDIKSQYQITNIQTGTYTIVASYLGYINKEKQVIVEEGKTLVVDFLLDYVGLEGEEIVVTAQAEAQNQAINQQLTAQSIKNIVSAKKIQEIPDANAAEAIGRLPGVSLIRSGGEGSKVAIRGLSPKYNMVQVDGVKMAATGSDDRSSDLSMISPFMLDGIEVSKAALPDKEADVIGGSVNFLLKEASEDMKFDLLAHSGYNGLKDLFGDYKIVGSGSGRFFENDLGIFAQIDIERRNRSSYELNVNYTNITSPPDPEEIDVSIGNLLVKDIDRNINRYGGTVVLDYRLPDGKIKMSNFLSRIENKNVNRLNNLRPSIVDQFFALEDRANNLTVMSNTLKIEQNVLGVIVDAGASFAFSENESPRDMILQGYQPTAFDVVKLNTLKYYQVDPKLLPNYLKDSLVDAYLFDVTTDKSYTRESKISGEINLKTTFYPIDFISVSLKTGGMIKHQNKKLDKEVKWMPINFGGGEPAKSIERILKAYPWMQQTAPLGSVRIPYTLIADNGYKPNNFLGGNYVLENMPQLQLSRDISTLLEDQYFYSYHRSIKDDYSGTEDYTAGYVMSEIRVGSFLTFIPGVRYEFNQTEYKGVRGNDQTLLENVGYASSDTTITQKNEYWLPMIHLKIKPVDWFDIRLAFTKTLSRPNYNQIVPSWNRSLNTITWNNPYLRPAQADNYDMYLSFYANEFGLLTAGGFYKEIKDLVFSPGPRAIIDTIEYGLPKTEIGKTIFTVINNKYKAYLSGVEIEWQANFWFLPGILKGIVLNTNYTHTVSSTRYPRTEKKTEYLDAAPWVRVTNVDTFYVDRLIDQPDDIFNITLGYDISDFSIRVSRFYQNDVFKRDHFYRKLRGNSDAYVRWDVSVKQKLPFEGVDIFGNFNNITNSIERDVNVGTGFPIREQFYDFTADVGIRYKF